MVGGTGAFQWGKGRRKLREKATTHKFRSRDLSEILSSAWIKRLNPGYATFYKTHTDTHTQRGKNAKEKKLCGDTQTGSPRAEDSSEAMAALGFKAREQ